MLNNFLLTLTVCYFAASISAEVWKTNKNGKSPHVFLEMEFDELNKECKAKQKSVIDKRVFEPYFKLYQPMQEEIAKKVKADSKANIDNIIMEECLTHPELKKQIANITDTLELCLAEADRLEKTVKDKLIQEVLEIKCANLKKAIIIRSEEKCMKKWPSACLEHLMKIQELLIPVPVKNYRDVCLEIQKLDQCETAMNGCKEETRKALKSLVSDEMVFSDCVK